MADSIHAAAPAPALDPAVGEVRAKVDAAWTAFQAYRRFDQAQIDRIVEAMAAAGRAEARRLAEMAVEETRYGNVKDKIAKNLLNADLLARAIRPIKTVGVLRELTAEKVIEVGVPLGIVAAILPTTNPTSTAIFKTLISLKAGNGIVISPHPRAARSTCYTAELLHRAAVRAGAPDGIIQCLTNPTIEATHALMKHPRIAVILATGGHGMVKAAYSSGKPAFGVGPGNVPVYLERSAPVAEAVAAVVAGKSFDYGTVCSSEQALVAEESLRDQVIEELKRQKAYLCNEAQQQAIARVLLKENYRINPECVGQSPQRIAQMAGFEVPADAAILVVRIAGVGKDHPLSVEKLSPVLALYFVPSHAAALDACEALLRFGGLGHTCVIHSRDEGRIREFGLRMPAMRVLVNSESPAGSTGVTTNLMPSMTLGCGAMAGNITSDNVGPQHLINIKRLAWAVRTSEEALPIPPEWRAVPRAAEVRSPRSTSAAEIVDRFLAARRTQPAVCPQAAQCPCAAGGTDGRFVPSVTSSLPSQTTENDRLTHLNDAAPPAPPVVIVDFVCESDVRAAIDKGAKIYIGPKTIVTPAARDLANRHDILVQAQRPQ